METRASNHFSQFDNLNQHRQSPENKSLFSDILPELKDTALFCIPANPVKTLKTYLGNENDFTYGNVWEKVGEAAFRLRGIRIEDWKIRYQEIKNYEKHRRGCVLWEKLEGLKISFGELYQILLSTLPENIVIREVLEKCAEETYDCWKENESRKSSLTSINSLGSNTSKVLCLHCSGIGNESPHVILCCGSSPTFISLLQNGDNPLSGMLKNTSIVPNDCQHDRRRNDSNASLEVNFNSHSSHSLTSLKSADSFLEDGQRGSLDEVLLRQYADENGVPLYLRTNSCPENAVKERNNVSAVISEHAPQEPTVTNQNLQMNREKPKQDYPFVFMLPVARPKEIVVVCRTIFGKLKEDYKRICWMWPNKNKEFQQIINELHKADKILFCVPEFCEQHREYYRPKESTPEDHRYIARIVHYLYQRRDIFSSKIILIQLEGAKIKELPVPISKCLNFDGKDIDKLAKNLKKELSKSKKWKIVQQYM